MAVARRSRRRRVGGVVVLLAGAAGGDELAVARLDGRFGRLTASWARIDVLVIDDFLLRPLTPDQAADTLEVIEDRAGLRSTIITSQLPIPLWHEALSEPTIADAVLDRMLQNLHRIELEGESMRRPENTPTTTGVTKRGPSKAKQASTPAPDADAHAEKGPR